MFFGWPLSLENGRYPGKPGSLRSALTPRDRAAGGLNANAEGGWVFLHPPPLVWSSDGATEHGYHPKDHCMRLPTLLSISFALVGFPGASNSLYFWV